MLNFNLKYEDSENIKSDRINTAIFNLHQIKHQAFFWDTRYVFKILRQTIVEQRWKYSQNNHINEGQKSKQVLKLSSALVIITSVQEMNKIEDLRPILLIVEQTVTKIYRFLYKKRGHLR